MVSPADAIAPADPDRWTWLQGLGRALMQLGRDAEAVDALSQSMDNNPGHLRGKAWLAAAEALSGGDVNARRHLAEYIAAEPEMTVERFAGERSSVPLDVVSPVYRREIERIFDGLRRAGMPEGEFRVTEPNEVSYLPAPIDPVKRPSTVSSKGRRLAQWSRPARITSSCCSKIP